MKFYIFLTPLFALFSCNAINAQMQFNGDFETIDPVTHFASGWSQPTKDQTGYSISLDSTIKQHGKYSISIAEVKAGSNFSASMSYIPKRFKGSTIELRGYIKTENVTGGFAGLWLRVDATNTVSAFNNMEDQKLKGTNDWKEYTIKLPYDSKKAISITAGGLLAGAGKMWFDNLQLLVDGQPIDKAEAIPIVLTKLEQDTAFSTNSGIQHIDLNPQQVLNLKMLGQVWGFIKYYHPAVADTLFNMDAELFRVMPAVINARDNNELSVVLEKWVDKFGLPRICSDCAPNTGDNVKLKPDYGQLFDHSVLSQSLTTKLTYILNNRNNSHVHAYVDMIWGAGNPLFNNENPYTNMLYPDAGIRLLCLFRYWNMINYFYPDRHLIGEDWSNVLPRFIPQFMNDANAQDYSLTTLALIASIHDTHANMWGYNAALENYRGKFSPPFIARFIGDQLVVTGYAIDTLGVKDKFKVGDVITAINDVSVAELIKKYLPITPASNYSTQLRDMPRTYLMRSNNVHFDFSLVRDGKKILAEIDGISVYKVNYATDYNANPKGTGYYLINKQIGYIYPGKYYNKDLDSIKKLFYDTKGIIVDMRCYPSDNMPYTFVPFVKTGNAPFVKFSQGRVAEPGVFLFEPPMFISPGNIYKGKVIVIVNDQTQSAAEFTTMALQSSSNVTVIGSTTAGADGNVSTIILPGDINTYISGIGVLYPDGTETQRKGVKIDIQMLPTLKGICDGRDELLDKAIGLIMK